MYLVVELCARVSVEGMSNYKVLQVESSVCRERGGVVFVVSLSFVMNRRMSAHVFCYDYCSMLIHVILWREAESEGGLQM